MFLSAEQKRGCSPRNPRRDSAEAGAVKEDDSGEEGKKEGGNREGGASRIWSPATRYTLAKAAGRRPFVPYKQNVVAFFAIANGLGRFVFVFSLCFLFVCLFS